MPEPHRAALVGVAHLQPPGELAPAGMSPRNGLDGKRAEKGASIALPGGLEVGDAAPRTCSVVVSLPSSVGRWVVGWSGRLGRGRGGHGGSRAQSPMAFTASLSSASWASDMARQAWVSQISARLMRPMMTTSEPRRA